MIGRSLLLKTRNPKPVYLDYVQEYINRVIAADVAAGNNNGLEDEVTNAISTCLQALVADGILGVSGGALSQSASLIKAGCFMMGARTLSGALVPLAPDMPAPTNFNFTGARYNRRTGLQGDGVATYLNSNRGNGIESQNNKHIATCTTTAGTGTRTLIGGSQDTWLARDAVDFYARVNQASSVIIAISGSVTGFIGASRSGPTAFTIRASGINTLSSISSTSPAIENLAVFRKQDATQYANDRLNFYSIGQSLDLAILDARITALSNAIQAAIAP